ncbi:uncharacterized protein METZ01_LOCUS413813, partial [marine metagenome]
LRDQPDSVLHIPGHHSQPGTAGPANIGRNSSDFGRPGSHLLSPPTHHPTRRGVV